VGVPRPEFTELIARALLLLGCEHAWVVHGADGIDEISTVGYTKVSECRDGSVHTFYLHPADVGVPKVPAATLKGGSAQDNARTIELVLKGELGPARDVVLVNAGAALFIAGAASSIREGMRRAAEAVDKGDAARTLERLVLISASEEAVAGAGQ
jgi:anthranilate phosphoribosyltransferase